MCMSHVISFKKTTIPVFFFKFNVQTTNSIFFEMYDKTLPQEATKNNH